MKSIELRLIKHFRGPSKKRLVCALSAVGALAAVAIAPALATSTWRPQLGRPGLDAPVATSSKAVDDGARNAVTILRRPQTDRDRSDAAPLLGAVANQVDDVQVDGIRSPKEGWAVVPVDTVRVSPTREAHDQLCLTDGTGITCASASDVAAHGVGLLRATEGATLLAGIVPDQVARVRYVTANGAAYVADVNANLYELGITANGAPREAPAPDGNGTVPGPPMPVSGAVEWLNSSGQVIGPQ